MSDQLQNLAAIFNNSIFRIPDYQRGYAWSKRQLEDFWSDLERATNTNHTHFCSQLTLESTPKGAWEQWTDERAFIQNAGYNPYYVVDGQQRLTTAIILIRVLLDGLKDDDLFAGRDVSDLRKAYLVKTTGNLEYCLFGYETDNPSHLYFRTQILRSKSNEYKGTLTLYTKNLEYALRFFTTKVSGATKEKKEAWFSALTQLFRFNVYKLSSDLDVFVAFETMNNRGKPLTRLELLKNRLIYLSTLATGGKSKPDGNAPAGEKEAFAKLLKEEQSSVRNNINHVWRTIYEILGKNPAAPLDDDDFLRAHFIAYFPGTDENDPLINVLINKHFHPDRLNAELREKRLTLPDIQTYIDSLQVSVRCWHKLHFPEDHVANLEQDIFVKLERVKRLGYGAFGPLMLAVLVKVDDVKIQCEIFDQMERFLLLVRSFVSARSDVARNESYSLAHGLFEGNKTGKDVIAAFKNRVQTHFSIELLQAKINEIFKPGGNGFYELNGLHYLLFEYEDELRRKAKAPASKISWKDFKGSWNTIEHIYPQQATDEDWPQFSSYGAEAKRHLCHSLGNLLALSHAKNAKLQRLPFQSKCENPETKQGYKVGSFSENRVALNHKWTAAEIELRGIELLEFIERRWSVSLGDVATKRKLLKADIWSSVSSQP